MSERLDFDNPWYGTMMEQVLRDHPDASDDAKLLARATMVAGAFAAYSIDMAFDLEGGNGSVRAALNDLASAAERIADWHEQRS